MKQSLCCGVPEGQASAYQTLPTQRAELGAHPVASEQPRYQSQELRADWLFLLSLCRPSCLPWFHYSKACASQFFRSGFRAENEGFLLEKAGGNWNTHLDKSCLMPSWQEEISIAGREFTDSCKTSLSVNFKMLFFVPVALSVLHIVAFLGDLVDGLVSQMNSLVRNHMPSFINEK